MENNICINCKKEIKYPKKKFCSKICNDKWLYHNNKNYKLRVINNSKNWAKNNIEKYKSIHTKSMVKYSKTKGFKDSVKKNYDNNKNKWYCRRITLMLVKSGDIKLNNKCEHKENLEIHHEIYPTNKEDIIRAVFEDKIYFLCRICHKKITIERYINKRYV